MGRWMGEEVGLAVAQASSNCGGGWRCWLLLADCWGAGSLLLLALLAARSMVFSCMVAINAIA